MTTGLLLTHLAGRVLNVPLAITPAKAQGILAVLGPRLGLAPMAAPDGPAVSAGDRGFRVVEGVAVVPLLGTIVKRASAVDANSGLVGTEAIGRTLRQALRDPDVRAILLHVDSHGGEVAGTADLAELIVRARGIKPIWAVADEAAYSAGYWIASAAERVVLPQTGGVGSIGVIAMHVDQSRADEQRGLTYTTVTAGAHKADFSPHAPLTDAARERLQAEVDRVQELFVAAVARHRGLDAGRIRAFEADTFEGRAALTAGLADDIATFEDTLLELATRPAWPAHSLSILSMRRTAVMSDPNTEGQPPESAPSTEAPARGVTSIEDARRAREEAAQAQAETARVREITELCAIARVEPARAMAFIAEGTSVAAVRTALLAQQADAAREEIQGALPATGRRLNPAAIFERRHQQVLEAQRLRAAQR